uniref:Acetyltransferase n=1 Tax=Cyanothece sp. (strain PCC 7425 / ATCC 29141) TaxID=395961 RepID=B8HSE3_CYAP4
MFLQNQETGSMVEILDLTALVNPVQNEVRGQAQAGQEEQQPDVFAKTNLVFPSGEKLPRCWVDANYRQG